ncbi:NAD(P)-binding protein [Stipitochalara longipes BDJ]|nr:NAD(P)-binding protein [Stipitochalara longipes BDJ]
MKTLLQPDRASKSVILTIVPLPVPVPNSKEHLICVHAAALTNGELLWMKNFPPPPSLSKGKESVPCYDMAGIAVTAPSDSPFHPGSEVFARTNYHHTGSGREYTICETSELAFKPKTLSFAQAATVPMSVETAYQALFVHGQFLPVPGTGAKGKRIFVTAGSGAAGMWVIQLAKWAGAEVVATASKGRLEFVKSLGASEALDYRNSDIKKWVEADGGRKADLVIDCIGQLADAWWVVKDGGTLISIFQPTEGTRPAELQTKNVKDLFFIQELLGEQAGEVAKLIDGGEFVTVVDSVWPLEEFKQAVERIESGKARGKVVIEFIAQK